MNDTLKTKHPRISGRSIIIMASCLIAVGYILMAGSADSDIFSPLRIAVAPVLCIAGYLLIAIGCLHHKHDGTRGLDNKIP